MNRAKAALAIGDRAYVLVEERTGTRASPPNWNDPVVAELYLRPPRQASEKERGMTLPSLTGFDRLDDRPGAIGATLTY